MTLEDHYVLFYANRAVFD